VADYPARRCSIPCFKIEFQLNRLWAWGHTKILVCENKVDSRLVDALLLAKEEKYEENGEHFSDTSLLFIYFLYRFRNLKLCTYILFFFYRRHSVVLI
jgi:hypothetical protein